MKRQLNYTHREDLTISRLILIKTAFLTLLFKDSILINKAINFIITFLDLKTPSNFYSKILSFLLYMALIIKHFCHFIINVFNSYASYDYYIFNFISYQTFVVKS